MPKIARLGDPSNHGGTIITACSQTYAYGELIARKGDLHSCPIPGHGITPIVSNTSPDSFCEGAEIAKVGSVCGCGAAISDGSPKDFVN